MEIAVFLLSLALFISIIVHLVRDTLDDVKLVAGIVSAKDKVEELTYGTYKYYLHVTSYSGNRFSTHKVTNVYQVSRDVFAKYNVDDYLAVPYRGIDFPIYSVKVEDEYWATKEKKDGST